MKDRLVVYDTFFPMKFGTVRISTEFGLELLLGRELLNAIKQRSTELTRGLHDRDFVGKIQ